MNDIELTEKVDEEETGEETFPVEDETFDDLHQSFDTVDMEQEGEGVDEFGQPLAVLAVTDKIKKKNGVVPMPKMRMCGTVHCFWHDSRGVPRITIGPNWDFSIILFVYATMLTVGHVYLFRELIRLDAGYYILGIGILLYLIGIYSFLATFLGDPGIPEEIFTRYSDLSFSFNSIDTTRTDLCKKCLVPWTNE